MFYRYTKSKQYDTHSKNRRQHAQWEKIITDLRRYRKGVEFDNPAIRGVVPEGYVTGDEFEKQIKENLDSYCKENGIL